MERTLAIIKPDAYAKADDIEAEIIDAGFAVDLKKDVQLTGEQCADFYIEHYGKHFYNDLVNYMSTGPVRVLVLSKPRAIGLWRQFIGPTDALKAKKEAPSSIRARYGTSSSKNAVHGSDSFVSAEREVHFFFPNGNSPSASINDQVKQYLAAEVNPTLLNGLTELCKIQPENPILWLADWLKANNPNATDQTN